MNKNTTDITLSAYFNDIVIGYYEDEELVKQFGRQLGFDVDMDVFMAVSFQYPSDMNVTFEDREKLTQAAEAVIALSEINGKINGKQIITCDAGVCVILITHDIGLVANMADRVLVMYAGQIIEEAPAKELFRSPKHPYTQALLNTVPTIRDSAERRLLSIPGIVPESYDDIRGCRFADRCRFRRPECDHPQEDYQFEDAHTAKCIVSREGGIPS